MSAAFLTVGVVFFGCSVFETVFSLSVDVLLQVLWTCFSATFPDAFRKNFGVDPIKTMATVLFVRHGVFNPLQYYLNHDQYVFSLRAVVWLAAGNTIAVIVGSLFFLILTEHTLRLLLGISSIVWVGVILAYLGKSTLDYRKEMVEFRNTGVTVSRECDLFDPNEPAGKTFPSCEEPKAIAGSSSVHPPFNRLPVNWRRRAECSQALEDGEEEDKEALDNGRRMKRVSARGVVEGDTEEIESEPQERKGELYRKEEDVEEKKVGMSSSAPLGPHSRETGRTRPPLLEVFLSTVTNDIFYSDEATTPQLHESFVPPLTPSKLSPCSTMSFTHVRINRVVQNGVISKKCLIGGAIAATIAGGFSAIVGVSSPAIFFYVLAFDLPMYLFHNILLAQTIPGGLVLLLDAFIHSAKNADVAGIVLLFLIAHSAGMLVGRKLRPRSTGKQSRLLYMCGLLFCQAAILVSGASKQIFLPVIIFFLVWIGFSYHESSRVKQELQLHQEIQTQREQRQRQALTVLRRDPSRPLRGRCTEEQKVPYWAGYDNDEDDDGMAQALPTASQVPQARESLPKSTVSSSCSSSKRSEERLQLESDTGSVEEDISLGSSKSFDGYRHEESD